MPAPLETAAAAIARLEAGGVSPRELFTSYRERIERADGDLGAFLWVAPAEGGFGVPSPGGG